MTELWPPLGFSLIIAGSATVLLTVIALPLAFYSAGHSFPGKSVVEALLVLPLVLPPTVVGYFLIVLFGRHGIVPGYSILFRPEGGVLAAAVVSLPLLYLPAKAAFGSVDREMLSNARLMGANPFQIFWHISLPVALPSVCSGLLLAFARAIGEFGATTMVMGNIENRQTLPIFIYNQALGGDLQSAAGAVWLLSILSMVIVFFFNHGSMQTRH